MHRLAAESAEVREARIQQMRDRLAVESAQEREVTDRLLRHLTLLLSLFILATASRLIRDSILI